VFMRVMPPLAVKAWMESNHIGGYYPRLQQLGVSVAEDLKYVDTMTMALDVDIVGFRKVNWASKCAPVHFVYPRLHVAVRRRFAVAPSVE
jgi:hypothetical protein